MIETDMLSISVVEAGFRIQRASLVEPEYIMQLKKHSEDAVQCAPRAQPSTCPLT